jgi:hypothetical protein
MDSTNTSLDPNLDLSKLSVKDKQELQQFIVNESQKARIQQCTSYIPLPSTFSGRRRPNSYTICSVLTDLFL